MTAQKETDPALAARNYRLGFVSEMRELCRNDPGARAALRGGLGRPLNHARVRPMHRLVAGWLPSAASDSYQRAHYTVAALIAAQPRHSFAASDDADAEEQQFEGDAEPPEAVEEVAGEEGEEAADESAAEQKDAPKPYGDSLGTAFALAVVKSAAWERGMRLTKAEGCLNILTRQSVNGLHRHLPSSVLYLRGLDVPVDMAQLLQDLIDWPDRSGRISRRWLQDFYRRVAGEEKRAKKQNEGKGAEGSSPNE